MIEFFRDKKYDAFIYSQIGQNHARDGVENQDSIIFEKISDQTWFIALADGVSTAAFAKKGSIAAVDAVKECARKLQTGELFVTDPDMLKIEIVKRWKAKFLSDWDDYATTLNFAIYNDSKIIAGQIGDGLIVLNADGQTKILADVSDFYSTETYALGSMVRKSTFKIEIADCNEKAVLYMASDGIGKEVTEEAREKLGQYIEKKMSNDDSSIEDELDTWVTGLGRKNGDDKSIGFVRWEE